MKIKDIALKIEPEVYGYYRYLHTNPELGLKEIDTSAFIYQQLAASGCCDEIIKIPPTGWVAVMHGAQDGPSLLLRADMDALPVTEDETHSIRSKNEGVMHACGHDAHASILLGTLRLLHEYKQQIAGTVYFFFQPAEEILSGAKLLLGSKEIPLAEISAVAACHVIPDFYGGEIGVKSGPVLAGADEFDILIKGKGGHAAHPYTTVDPIVIAAAVIEQVQKLVSRETSALDAAVVSICGVQSDGFAYNVIPDQVKLRGTLRTINQDTRARLQLRLKQLVEGVCATFGATAEVCIHNGPPPLSNDESWVARTKNVMAAVLGADKIKTIDVATMGAEDFAFIKERYPGVFVRIGCRVAGQPFTPIHSSKFIVDRAALITGMLTLGGITLDFFGVDKDEFK